MFYGWWLVAISFPLVALPIGFVSFGFSFFIEPLRQEFGWTVAQIVFVLSLGRLEGGFVTPIAGFVIDRWGARNVMILGQFLSGLGLVLVSQVHELWQFYAAMLIAISGNGLGSMFPMTAVLMRWFVRRRGRAIGVMNAGASFAQGILPAVAILITVLGWRGAVLAMGVIIWIVGVPLAALIRNDPYRYGLRPDGDPPENAPDAAPGAASGSMPAPRTTQEGMSWRQAVRSQPFWMIGIATAVWSLYHGTLRVFLIPHIEGMGYSREFVGAIMFGIFLIGFPGRIIAGWVADYIRPKPMFVGIFVVQALGLLILGLSTHWWHLAFYALAYEWAVGGYLVLQAVIVATYFGVANFATIRGLMQIMGVAGGFLGPVMGGLVVDATGSYASVFIGLAAFAFLGVPFVLLAREERNPVGVSTNGQ